MKRRSLILVTLACVFLLLLVTSFLAFRVHFMTESSHQLERRRPGAGPLSQEEIKVKQLTDKHRIIWTCNYEKLSASPWLVAETLISPRAIIIDGTQQHLGCILNAMRRSEIIHADVGTKGTQLKLSLTLLGNQRVVFKPEFYQRDFIMVGTPYAGKDRHNAEIAAFHLNRIIGLNKVPLVVGRTIDLESDIRPVAHKNLLSTFYYTSGNTCFYGRCHYCKGPETGVCANRTILEGSVTLWLPDSYALGSAVRHPWARTYNERRKAAWEDDSNYCNTVINKRPYEVPPRLLDLIDIAIFDFLISNADRHHYETFEYSKEATVVALDNGKSFGDPYVDEISILAPLYQCCRVRNSTYYTLNEFKGDTLGKVFYNILSEDPMAPLLKISHFKAVNRRLKTVLDAIKKCINTKGLVSVVLDDGF